MQLIVNACKKNVLRWFLTSLLCKKDPNWRRQKRKKKKMKKTKKQDKKRRIREKSVTREARGASHTVAWDSRIIPWQTINYWHYVLECLLAPATNHRSVDLWPRSVRSILRCIRSHARVHAPAPRRRSGTTHCPFSVSLPLPCPSSSKITINHS